jgi:putative resolvase
LSEATATVLVVEHRDRLTRFGLEHLEAVLSGSGRRVVVLDPQEVGQNRADRAVAVATEAAQ